MVENKKYSDQEDFDFVQNLFDQLEPETASPDLRTRILTSAPTEEMQHIEQIGGAKASWSANWTEGLDELIEYLWPFGSLWRPAAGLTMAAIFGIMVGLTDPLSAASTVSQEEALTEEIVAFAVSADGQFEDLP